LEAPQRLGREPYGWGRSMSGYINNNQLDFDKINKAALAALPAILNRLLPRGKTIGREFVAINPRRSDHNLGSFKINRYNCKWCDFSSGDKGGDPISLVAYIADVSQGEAAKLLAQMLGLDQVEGRKHGR
jgi:hypothetical protein